MPYHAPSDKNFPSFEYGDKVVVRRENQQLQYAKVKFCGYTKFCEGIFWFGVELDQANGKNDGSVQASTCTIREHIHYRKLIILSLHLVF